MRLGESLIELQDNKRARDTAQGLLVATYR